MDTALRVDILLRECGLTLFKAGVGWVGAESTPPVLFRPKHPEGLQKVEVMGYVNFSYYIGKTPKKVLGPKKFCGPVQKPSKSGWRKIMEP